MDKKEHHKEKTFELEFLNKILSKNKSFNKDDESMSPRLEKEMLKKIKIEPRVDDSLLNFNYTIDEGNESIITEPPMHYKVPFFAIKFKKNQKFALKANGSSSLSIRSDEKIEFNPYYMVFDKY